MLWLGVMLQGRTQVPCDRLASAEPEVTPPARAAACDDVESEGVIPSCRLLKSLLHPHLQYTMSIITVNYLSSFCSLQ